MSSPERPWSEHGTREASVIDFEGLDEERREAAEIASFRASLQEPARDDEFVVTDEGGGRETSSPNSVLLPIYLGLSGLAFLIFFWHAIEALGLEDQNTPLVLMGVLFLYLFGVLGIRAWWRRDRSRPVRAADYVTSYRLSLDPTSLRLQWGRTETQTSELCFPLSEIAHLDGMRRLVLVRVSGERVQLPCSVVCSDRLRFATHAFATRCNEILGEMRMLGGYRGDLPEAVAPPALRRGG